MTYLLVFNFISCVLMTWLFSKSLTAEFQNKFKSRAIVNTCLGGTGFFFVLSVINFFNLFSGMG